MTPPPGLKSRVLAAATGERAPRPSILPRLFWAAAAVALFSIVISTISRPTFRTVQLVGTNEAPKARGRVRWSGAQVTLEVAGLPRPPKGKVYQLWHVGPTPTPTPQALFSIGVTGRISGADIFKHPIAKGHAFALTLEPEGGSRTPTMPLYFVAAVP